MNEKEIKCSGCGSSGIVAFDSGYNDILPKYWCAVCYVSKRGDSK